MVPGQKVPSLPLRFPVLPIGNTAVNKKTPQKAESLSRSSHSHTFNLAKNCKYLANANNLARSDLIGFKVICKGSVNGEVTDYINSEVNPLLECERNGKTFFIPINSDMIDEVNLEEKTITVISTGEGLYL